MWWLVAGRVWAGVPVVLPPTEQAQDWVGVLALGGLDWATGVAPVMVEDHGGSWVVTVGRGAAARTATVAAPHTASQREDVVWLVVSLSSAVSAAPPSVPPPVEAPPAPRPAPARPRPQAPPPVTGLQARGPSVPVGPAPPERPAPDPELELPDRLPGMPDPEPERVFALPPAPERPQRPPLIELPEPPADAGALRPWARAATAIDWHDGAEGAAQVGPRPTGEIAGGIARDQLGIGAGVRFGPRSHLDELGPNRRWSEFELSIEGWATPSWVRVGLGTGVALRSFEERGRIIGRGAMPYVRGTLAAGVYLGERWSLEPGVSAHLDLGLTELRLNGARVGTLPGRGVSPGLAVRWR